MLFRSIVRADKSVCLVFGKLDEGHPGTLQNVKPKCDLDAEFGMFFDEIGQRSARTVKWNHFVRQTAPHADMS